MNKAFMLHVFSLPVGSAGVAVVSLLPSVCGDSDTFSSGFCFFSLPRGFGKQHHIEVMPALKPPGQGCSGACRDQGGSCPTPKLCS